MRLKILPPRLLPVALIGVCALLIAKSVEVYSDFSAQPVAAEPVLAAFPTASGPSPAPAAPEAATPAEPAAEAPAAPAADAGTHPAEGTPPAEKPRPTPPVGANGLLADGGAGFSEEELKVLQKLADRREALAVRTRDMDRRQAILTAAEARIDEKIARLEDLRAVLETLVEKQESEQESKLASLVKIYENMKPKDAARIFEELEMETLLPVAERMKEKKLAAIMAVMNPSKAKEVTVELAQLRRLIDQSTDSSMPQG